MSIKMKASFWAYLLALLILAAFGLIYLFNPQFMPYHADAVGMSWEEVPPAFQILLLALMKTAGGAMSAAALALTAILLVPFRKGQTWAKWLLLVASLVCGLPALYAALSVRAATPAEPPWILALAAIGLALLGFLLSVSETQPQAVAA